MPPLPPVLPTGQEPKRRGRKPKTQSQTSEQLTAIFNKQISVKPQDNIVLYLNTSLTDSQRQKIKQYSTSAHSKTGK